MQGGGGWTSGLSTAEGRSRNDQRQAQTPQGGRWLNEPQRDGAQNGTDIAGESEALATSTRVMSHGSQMQITRAASRRDEGCEGWPQACAVPWAIGP
eukprot:1844091-Pleurochrysis_carterae.AAC.1